MAEATVEVTELPEPQPEDKLFDLPALPSEAPETPTPEAAVVPTSEVQGELAEEGKETPEPEPKPSLPEWFANVPEADRPAILEDLLNRISPEERLKLSPIGEVVSRARQSQSAITRQQAEAERNEASRQYSAAQAYNTLAERFEAGEVSDLKAELDNYGAVAGGTAQHRYAEALGNALVARAAGLGISQLPDEVMGRIAQTQNQIEGYGILIDHLIERSADRGRSQAEQTSATANKAQLTTDRARLRDEILADLKAEGRVVLEGNVATYVPEKVPPVLGGTTVASEDLTQDEFDAAMRSTEVYERLSPEKQDALRKLMVSAL